MDNIELIQQAAFQRGFEKQSMSLLTGIGKGVKNLGSTLWQAAKPKPNPLFAPVFNPQAIKSVATATPKFNSKELMRLEKLIASMNKGKGVKPVAMAPAFNQKELARLEKLIASMQKGKAAKPGLIGTGVRDFSQPSSLNPIGITMGGPKIF